MRGRKRESMMAPKTWDPALANKRKRKSRSGEKRSRLKAKAAKVHVAVKEKTEALEAAQGEAAVAAGANFAIPQRIKNLNER